MDGLRNTDYTDKGIGICVSVHIPPVSRSPFPAISVQWISVAYSGLDPFTISGDIHSTDLGL